jgi:hypothetical protein
MEGVGGKTDTKRVSCSKKILQTETKQDYPTKRPKKPNKAIRLRKCKACASDGSIKIPGYQWASHMRKFHKEVAHFYKPRYPTKMQKLLSNYHYYGFHVLKLHRSINIIIHMYARTSICIYLFFNKKL